MNSESTSRFNVDALREHAGRTVFARGETYFREDRVELLAITPDRVLAHVSGTEGYRAELTGGGRSFDGECTCRAFEDHGFCKHLVAAALATNAGKGARELKEGGGKLANIRKHLLGKGVEALVDMIMNLAERDLALFRRLDMAAVSTNGDGKAIETRLSRAIDDVTHAAEYVEYGEAGGWAADVDAVLDALAGLPANGHGELALQLADRAIDRIERAIASIDDSDGHCDALLERTRDIHLAAARVARPEPVSFARVLFERETAGDYDTFHSAANIYADVLGEEGLAEYRRLATAAWEEIPPRSGGRGVRQYHDFAADLLLGILDSFAARDGDLDARIALRTKDLSSQWRYLQLAEFCRMHGREEEALRWVEEGLWVFEDEAPDHRLILFAAELLSKAGRNSDALQHLWRTFGKSPTLELYKRLRQIEGEAAADAAVRSLEGGMGIAPKSDWQSPRADLLVEILIHEERLDAAWAAAKKHSASMHIRRTLARASETTHPERAIGVYAEYVEQLVNTGGNYSYEEAARLIARIGGLRDAAGHAAYVAELKLRHKRKRNFMKLLG